MLHKIRCTSDTLKNVRIVQTKSYIDYIFRISKKCKCASANVCKIKQSVYQDVDILLMFIV